MKSCSSCTDSGRAFAFKPDEPDLYLVGTGVNKKMFFFPLSFCIWFKLCTSAYFIWILLAMVIPGWWFRIISFQFSLRWGRGLPLYNSIRLHLHQHVQGNLLKPHEKSKHGIVMTGLITFSKSFDSFRLLWEFWQPLLNNANNINNPADFVNTHIQSQRQGKHVLKKLIKYTRLITAQCTVSNGIPSSPVSSSGWRKSEYQQTWMSYRFKTWFKKIYESVFLQKHPSQLSRRLGD